MKKFASIVASATLLGSGLVAATASTTTAAPFGEPYPGSIPTTCSANNYNNPREGDPARVWSRATTGGNGAATGRMVFSYERKSNKTVVAEYRRRYVGPTRQNYSFSGIPTGRYTVKVFFNSRPGDSVYQNCSTSFDQRIRPAR